MTPLATPVCALIGIDRPIVQAPIGSACNPRLAAAVSGAGGLGMLALTWTSEEGIAAQIADVRRLTPRPFGVNLVLDFPVAAKVTQCLDLGVPVISTFWGDPAPFTDEIDRAGALHVHTIGSVGEAEHAAAAGVDVIVAQGWEAGGHVRGAATTMALVPAVVDAVRPLPVLAAGGIADGRGLAAALALGAEGAWIGTRFLTATEASTHELYRQAVIGARAEQAVYTRCFDGGWPDAPHRVLGNDTVAAWDAAGRPAAPSRPGEGDVVAVDGNGQKHLRYDDTIPRPGMTGDLQQLALYAGQSAGLVTRTQPAAQIVEEIACDAAGI